MKKLPLILATVLAAVTGGCGTHEKRPIVPAVNSYLSSQEDLGAIRTVAMLELAEEPAEAGVAGDLTQNLADAIRQKRLFHLDVVGRDEDVYRLMPIGKVAGPLTLRELSDIRNTLGCDAVLLGVVTNFKPYPHMQLGLRLRLIDLRKGQLVWAVDNVWQAGQRSMEERMADYYRDSLAREYQPLDWRLALLSPKAFEGFVSYETAQTLVVEPPRQDIVKSAVKVLKNAHRTVDSTVDSLSDSP